MARADTKSIAICEGSATFLPVGGKCLGVLDCAIWMFQVAMHKVSLVTVLSDRRGRSLILARENPKRGRKKQRSNEHYAKDLRWWTCSL